MKLLKTIKCKVGYVGYTYPTYGAWIEENFPSLFMKYHYVDNDTPVLKKEYLFIAGDISSITSKCVILDEISMQMYLIERRGLTFNV
jgi:hypothetical protein